MLGHVVMLVATLGGHASPPAAEEGLVAHYPCDEGSGTRLRDASGHGNDGAVSGATFVRFGEGWALRFDGVDDFVDCGRGPGLSPERAVSVEAWVYPEAVPGAGEAGIIGKGYESFVLTYYVDGQCWWYISGGGNNCQAALTVGAWHHVVGTFDGKTLKLYLDGSLADTHASRAETIGQGGALFLGKSEGDPQFTHNAHFKGTIDEVRVYDRALSADEVRGHFRTTHLTQALAVACFAQPYLGEVSVRVDTRGLGELAPDAAAVVSVRQVGSGKELAKVTIQHLPAWGTAEARLGASRLPRGEYEVVAQAVNAAGGKIGGAGTARVQWAGKPTWEGGGQGMRVLNNLVTELLNVDAAEHDYTFTNPRDGWVFFSSSAELSGTQRVRLILPGPAGLAPVLTHQAADGRTAEAMRWLAKGSYTMHVHRDGARRGRVIVRAIPELVYAKCGADPHVSEFGPYDWEFLKRHVLPNLNTMVGNGSEEQRAYVKEWKQQGKRWIVECGVPGLADGSKVTADEAETFWTGNPGMKDPLLDGVIADEFWGGDRPQLPAWTEAVRRMAADPDLKGRTFYPYCGPMYGAPLSRAFLQAVLDAGYRFALERYLPEQRTEAQADGYLDSMLREQAVQSERAMPGSVKQTVVCFGYFSAPPESLDVNPGVDHKVYLDKQFHLVANDPAFWRVSGLMTYLSSYADEETVRWAARLFRHYAIEGHAERLTKDPYVLPHLRNPDFEEGLAGWEVAAAEEGSVSVGSMSGYGWLQGRYPPTSQGDTFLVLKRSAAKPNRVSQVIRKLEPGRLYSLRAFTGAIRELDREQKLAVSIEVKGGDGGTGSGAASGTGRSFQHVFPNCYSHHLPPFDDQHRAWMNYHFRVFRAKATEAEVVISDWVSPEAAGGPVGQEIAVNFVEVQPWEGRGTGD